TGAGSERNRVGVVVAAAFPPPVDRGADREAAGARGRVTMIVGDRQQRELVGGAAAMLRAGIIAAGLGGGEMRLLTPAPEALDGDDRAAGIGDVDLAGDALGGEHIGLAGDEVDREPVVVEGRE